MGLVINLGQVIDIEMGVFLSGGQADVAQQFLDGAQVRAHLQQMGGERVAQGVRGHGHADAGPQAVHLDRTLDAACGQPAALAVEEERLPLRRKPPADTGDGQGLAFR